MVGFVLYKWFYSPSFCWTPGPPASVAGLIHTGKWPITEAFSTGGGVKRNVLRLRAWIHGWWRELCCFRLRTFGGRRRLRVAVNREFQWSSDSFNTCKVTCSSWKHKLGANGGNLVSNLAAQTGMCLKWDAFKSRLETNLLSIWHFSILGVQRAKHVAWNTFMNSCSNTTSNLHFWRSSSLSPFLARTPLANGAAAMLTLGPGSKAQKELWDGQMWS